MRRSRGKSGFLRPEGLDSGLNAFLFAVVSFSDKPAQTTGVPLNYSQPPAVCWHSVLTGTSGVSAVQEPTDSQGGRGASLRTVSGGKRWEKILRASVFICFLTRFRVF